jgi:glutamate/tyrosine decarboxylase-like PLP-dependent enzyme
MSRDFPYADRFPVIRGLPVHGRPREEILTDLRTMASEEDAFWETGKCSGTMYCGDHEHYQFMDEAFGLFAHVNALQRDMCPSATRFEGEIIAMALDLFHAAAVTDGEPAGLVTTGGTGSILHAVLAYRDRARAVQGITHPNIVKPETAHPAFDKAGHLFGVEVRTVPVDPVTTLADVTRMAEVIERGTGLHVDACLGGFLLQFGRELDIAEFDFGVPGVTSISADTHKYGYAFKGTSTCLFRDKSLRNHQYFHLTSWSGGKYCSPGIEGSRSGGLLASAWASMVQLGRDGYLAYAEQIFAAAERMKAAVRSHPELQMMGTPTFLFSFTSDVFDIYHVNDFMRGRGWRFNGQQYPNAIHMATTRPQTRPGVVEAFGSDLTDAVAYATTQHAAGVPAFSGAIYGGVEGGATDESEAFIRTIMSEMLDTQQSLPPLP